MKGSLDELLRAAGLADDELLVRARQRAGREGIVLVRALIDEGISERRLAEEVAGRTQLPLVELPAADDPSTDPEHDEALRQVPHSLALHHGLVPLAIDRTDRAGAAATLRLAMADPFDGVAVEEIEASSGMTVAPVVARLSAVLARARFVYRGSITEMIGRPLQMSRGFGVVAPGRALEPKTTPLHAVQPEASLEVRLAALVELLEANGLIDAADLAERVRRLQREREATDDATSE